MSLAEYCNNVFDPVTVEFRPADVPLTAEQAELRRLVHKQVRTHPDTFDMEDWEFTLYPLVRFPWDTCRTTRCIAGWAQYLARGRVSSGTVVEDAVRLLGITKAEWEGREGDEELFWDDNGPRILERLDALVDGL